MNTNTKKVCASMHDRIMQLKYDTIVSNRKPISHEPQINSIIKKINKK